MSGMVLHTLKVGFYEFIQTNLNNNDNNFSISSIGNYFGEMVLPNSNSFSLIMDLLLHHT